MVFLRQPAGEFRLASCGGRRGVEAAGQMTNRAVIAQAMKKTAASAIRTLR
jgi:hypothetical protein